MNRPLTKLQQARLARGLSQLELSAATGVERTLISRIENGMRSPRSQGPRKISAFFGLEVSELAQPAELSPKAREMLEQLGDRPASALAGLGDSRG